MTAFVYDSAEYDPSRLGESLTDGFTTIRDALESGESVVVLLDEDQLSRPGDPWKASLASGLIGLVRALAFEGRKQGWQINALALPGDTDPQERTAWVERLSSPTGANGVLVRLGQDHLGKVPF